MRESSADAGRLGSQQSNHCIPNSIGLELRVTRERTIYITKKVIGYKHCGGVGSDDDGRLDSPTFANEPRSLPSSLPRSLG
ncbi:unnamed protein product [Dovyalis caffra]|uniref:Uncharacterized protein n=1 Tax=Dovyalis caffra TaxID=77055 RepID=A0AAV1R3Q5_9ROSI|nr:unnamed protein product [Dovyalis caffra]